MDILKKTVNTIKKYSMLSEGECVLIGLSGGPDSVCLTIILDKLKEDFNLTLNAVYVDHGLRPDEVEHERSFCKTLCESFGITFFTKSVDVKGYAGKRRLNQQEAARELRYQVYEKISGEINATKISLAHNADDQAETFLMRLLRGSGRKGLSGIPPVRGKIIRPLIEVERKDIEEFLTVNCSLITTRLSSSTLSSLPKGSPKSDNSSPPFIIDSSNLKTDYFRNWIRQKILPELKNQNPALIKGIGRIADILREEDAYLENVVNKTLMKLISRKTAAEVELFLLPLENMEKPILRRVLRGALNETICLRGIDFIHIEEIIKLVEMGKSGDTLDLPKGIRVVKGYSTLLFTLRHPLKLKTSVFNPPGELALQEAGIFLRVELSEEWNDDFNGKDTAVFDSNKVTFPIEVRMRQKGDYFYPSGFGRRKKLQDFFVDNKIPRDKRDVIPIMVSGKEVIWVVGYRMDERFKAKEGTKRFLIMKSFKL